MIIFENVTKVYENGTSALNGMNLVINNGEFVFIVGPSGAGKSTVTKLIMKEETATSGTIHVGDYEVTGLAQSKLPYFRRTMGFVFQDFRLLPNKTVYDNIAFAMRIIGAPQRTIRRRIPDVLSMVGLAHKARMLPGELSGGEQQRVALARAIINKPLYLVADEPTGNLDPVTSWDIMNLLDDINKSGTTVIVATHAKEIVTEMKKRVIAVENGVIVRDEERGEY